METQVFQCSRPWWRHTLDSACIDQLAIRLLKVNMKLFKDTFPSSSSHSRFTEEIILLMLLTSLSLEESIQQVSTKRMTTSLTLLVPGQLSRAQQQKNRWLCGSQKKIKEVNLLETCFFSRFTWLSTIIHQHSLSCQVLNSHIMLQRKKSCSYLCSHFRLHRSHRIEIWELLSLLMVRHAEVKLLQSLL